MLKEIYYWMVYYLRKVKTNDRPEYNSFLLVSLMVFSNIATILVIVSYIFYISIKFTEREITIVGLSSGLCVGLICYLFTYKQKREIHEKYNNLPKKRRIKGIVFFWIYSLLSIPLFYILVVNLRR